MNELAEYTWRRIIIEFRITFRPENTCIRENVSGTLIAGVNAVSRGPFPREEDIPFTGDDAWSRQRSARAMRLAMPPSRTPLISPELPAVRRGARAIRGRGSARGSTPTAAGSRAWLRRPRDHPPSAMTDGGWGEGAASPTRHLSPRLLSVPLPMPLARGPHAHKNARVWALAASARTARTHAPSPLPPLVLPSERSHIGPEQRRSGRPRNTPPLPGEQWGDEGCRAVSASVSRERRLLRRTSSRCDVAVAEGAPPFSYRQARPIANSRTPWSTLEWISLDNHWGYHW